MSRVIRGGGGGGTDAGAGDDLDTRPKISLPQRGAGKGSPRVVPAEVFDAGAEAQRILATAEHDAAEIRTAAEREAGRIREQARCAGTEAGRAEVAALVLRAAGARDATLAGAERELATLALAAAKRIVGEELSIAPDRIGAVVDGVLTRARRARNVRVRVHPDDAEALRRLHARAPGEAGRAALAIEPDAALTRGGCVIETDLGELDARLEVQIAALARALGCEPP